MGTWILALVCLAWSKLHYWLRPIKRGQFRLANFAPYLKGKCYFHFLNSLSFASIPSVKIGKISKKSYFSILEVQFQFQLVSLFRAFFLSMVYVFTMQKISLNWAPLQDFLNIVLNFGKTCFQKNVVNIFWCKIWVITISKSVKFLILWVLLNENECLLLSTFSTFQTPLTNLTNSALICLGLLGLFQITIERLKCSKAICGLDGMGRKSL